MATLGSECFEGKGEDAPLPGGGYAQPMINNVMNRGEWGLLLGLALIWGSAFIFIKEAVTHVEPLTYVWLRLAMAALGLWLFLWWRGDRLSLPVKVWGAILLLALLNNVIPFALFGWGQRHIATGLAAILNATTPIWGVLAAHLFTADERITPGKLLGVVIGFIGVATMIGPDLIGSSANLLAQLACLLAALCYALAGVWARRFRRLEVPPMKVAAAQLIAGAAFLLPVVLMVDRPWLAPMPPLEAWGSIAILALLGSAYAYVLYFRLIDSAGATNAFLVTLLVPPVAILLGAVLLGERLGSAQLMGLGFIALGLAVIDGRLVGRLRLKPVENF
ncbi:MAG: DMT family transporter [Sphingomonas sp.]|nr:DMT family transporter [Sphingomonas sp.]